MGAPPAVPVMRMGLIGFADEARLARLLQGRSRYVRWEIGPFVEADALWVNGTHAQLVRGNLVRIPSTQPNRPATVLNMKEVDRPLALTLPIAHQAIHPPFTFDPQVAASVAEVLARFEEALMPIACQLLLGEQIAARRYELKAPTYHLSIDGTLVGVVNVNGDIGLAPRLSPPSVARAQWGARPGAAAAIPAAFVKTTMAQVMWQYVMRLSLDMVPSRYRNAPIHFRRMPKVAARMMRDTHLLVISELQGRGPLTIAQLKQGTGLDDAHIGPVLSALYFSGALTLEAAKATAASREGPASESWATTPGSPGEAIPPRPGRRAKGEIPTVPTPLQPGG